MVAFFGGEVGIAEQFRTVAPWGADDGGGRVGIAEQFRTVAPLGADDGGGRRF